MAIFRASIKTFSRARGETSTAAAAYRAGSRIRDDRTGTVHDYRRRGGVASVRTLAPHGAPEWAFDPDRLWNEAERVERVNGRPARELLVALPAELDGDRRERLARELGQALVDRYGVAAMVAIHAPSAAGDQRNHHTHILFTTRRLDADGFREKTRVLDDRVSGPKEIDTLRELVAERINAALIAAGISGRVDQRKLSVQAAEAESAGDIVRAVMLTRAVARTEGKAATAARRRRESTPRTRWNDAVRHDNRMVLANFFARTKAAFRTPARPRRLDLHVSSWSEPGRGPGTRLLNVQAERLRRARKADEAGVRRWLAMLERERLRLAEESQRTLAAYAVAARLKRADVRALIAHAQRDSSCFEELQRVLDAREKYLATLRHSQQAEVVDTLIRTAPAVRQRKAIKTVFSPGGRPMTRRSWAEHRRRQRAELQHGHANESGVVEGLERAGAAAALAKWERLEQQRRTRYPCPTDCTNGVGKVGGRPRKICNKIAEESEGEPRGAPRQALTPHPRRQSRPRI